MMQKMLRQDVDGKPGELFIFPVYLFDETVEQLRADPEYRKDMARCLAQDIEINFNNVFAK